MPFKKGLYVQLFKRSEHETDEEYVKNCEEAYTLLCCMGLYSSGNEAIRENIKEYVDKKYSDCIDNQLLELMKRDLENEKKQRMKILKILKAFKEFLSPKMFSEIEIAEIGKHIKFDISDSVKEKISKYAKY